MSMLNPQELKQVREQAALNLPETVDLRSKSVVSDGRGGLDESNAITYTDVPARLAERKGEETVFAGRDDVLADYILTVAFDQPIDRGMEVDHDGQLYDVKFVNDGRSYDTVKRCLVQRI